jgi:hypothetical protein
MFLPKKRKSAKAAAACGPSQDRFVKDLYWFEAKRRNQITVENFRQRLPMQ